MSDDPIQRPRAIRGELIRAAVADRMPVGLRTARLGVDLRAIVVIVLAALLGAGIGVAYWLLSRPVTLEEDPRAAAVAAAASASPSFGASPESTRPTAAELVIDVEGKVRRPGIVRVPTGARVIDAVAAAGGALPGADTSGLNLARLLVDGEQIFVGVPPPPGAGPPAGGSPSAPGASATPLDLNTASVEQLEQLPGVGPVLAQRIVDYRTEHGGFASVEELRQVTGIGDQRFADLKDLVRVP